LIGIDGKPEVLIVAIVAQSRAIKAALAGRRGAQSVTAHPLGENEYDELALTEEQVMISRRAT
jgi:hypothetical protein